MLLQILVKLTSPVHVSLIGLPIPEEGSKLETVENWSWNKDFGDVMSVNQYLRRNI